MAPSIFGWAGHSELGVLLLLLHWPKLPGIANCKLFVQTELGNHAMRLECNRRRIFPLQVRSRKAKGSLWVELENVGPRKNKEEIGNSGAYLWRGRWMRVERGRQRIGQRWRQCHGLRHCPPCVTNSPPCLLLPQLRSGTIARSNVSSDDW